MTNKIQHNKEYKETQEVVDFIRKHKGKSEDKDIQLDFLESDYLCSLKTIETVKKEIDLILNK